ncbi:MAG: ABC transporter ATP-binding protein [Candidatus Nitrosocosmicus sp.]
MVKNLTIEYDTGAGNLAAVEEVSFEIEDEQSIGIVGESGSGKSTLALALLRSLPQNGLIKSGNVIIKGHDILNLTIKKFDEIFRWKQIAMIFQGSMNSLDPVFTIENQMKEILKVHKVKYDRKKYDTIIKNAIKAVGLDPEKVAKRYPHELSGGMKQRIVIAISLLLEPSLLIADEPTTALDVITQSQIISLLKNMKNTKKMKIILITHDLSLIPNLADKVIIMYAGQAVEISDINTILNNPLHPYTQALIKSIPKINDIKKKSINFISGESPNLLNLKVGCRFKDRCSQAINICQKTPPNIRIGNNQVKCWLYDNEYKK